MPVATKVSGVSKIIEGMPAEKLLFEPEDVDGFAEKIEIVLSMSHEELMATGLKLKEECKERLYGERIVRKLLDVCISI